jgi:hypothetical protein
MSKKKGLGRDINISLEMMEEMLSCLKKFHGMPLKRGLKSNKVQDDDLSKMVNKVMEDAFSLSIAVGDLKDHVSGAKPKGNTRFACRRVISKFLESSE